MRNERWALFRIQGARLGVTEMSARLGRHRSMIYRGLARNHFRDPDAIRDRRRGVSGYRPGSTSCRNARVMRPRRGSARQVAGGGTLAYRAVFQR